jgi:hypothetical protein
VLSPVNTNNDQSEFKLIEKEEISEPVMEVVREKTLPLIPAEEPLQVVLPKEEIKKRAVKETIDTDLTLEIKEAQRRWLKKNQERKKVMKIFHLTNLHLI